MKDAIIIINRKFISSKSILSKSYDAFLESRYFWILSLVTSFVFWLYTPYLFLKIHLLLGLLFSIFAIFFMLTLIPAFYYKSQGIDFFNDVIIHKNISTKSLKIRTEIELHSRASIVLIEEFYMILQSANLIDETLIGNHVEIDLQEVFSLKYIKSFIEEISEEGTTDKRLYLSTNQKMAGYVLFEILRPLIKKDVKSIYNLVYYSQKSGFKQVKYDCISDSNKRGIDPRVEALLPEFIKKVRLTK